VRVCSEPKVPDSGPMAVQRDWLVRAVMGHRTGWMLPVVVGQKDWLGQVVKE
jgi:hypothetical protein